MTKFNMKEHLENLAGHVTFEYNGLLCGIDPLSRDMYNMWCGPEIVTVNSIDEVMTIKFFAGRPLRDILDNISGLDY